MTRTPALLAATITLALTLALTACGGSDSGLSKEGLITQGDRICQEGQQTIDRKVKETFTTSPTSKDLVKFIKQAAVPAYQDQLTKLKELEPDNDSADAWNDMTAKLDEGLKELADDPASTVSGKSSPLDEAGKAARDFGLKVCGSQD